MTLRVRAILFILIASIAPGLAPLAGQSKPQNGNGNRPTETDLVNARPGRDPNQPIDEEYTKQIKQYTTETFFLSPLVDYMPASKTVPTPKAVLGDIAGAEGKLPYTKEIYEYMRLLAKSTPRVRYEVDAVLGLPDIDDADHVHVMDLAGELGLAIEPLAQLVVGQ